MDKDAIAAFIKKNMVSLISGVIALLAVVSVFYPLGGMVDTLQASATEKAQLYTTLKNFLKDRKLPVNSLDGTDPGKLAFFPNNTTIKAGQEAVKKWKEDSDRTVSQLIEMNKKAHPLMLANPDGNHLELPMPNYPPDVFNIAKIYLDVLSSDPTISGVAKPDAGSKLMPDKLLVENGDQNLQNDILHGGTPPSPSDVQAAKFALWTNTYKKLIIEQNGKEINYAEQYAAWKADADKLPLALEKNAARTLRVYVDPGAFSVNPNIKPDLDLRPMDIWYCQMQIWIERDLCLAIADANSKSSSVLDAPVKRVMSMAVNPPPMYTRQTPVSGQSGPAAPAAVAPVSDSAPITADYSVSPTGRYSNPMYDVVPFVLYVDVDAAQVNHFLETLSKNTFMTVLTEDIWALDADTEFAAGFLYGRASVVRMKLTGESLFFRGWTAPGAAPNTLPQDLMPVAIKETLGMVAPGTSGPGGAAPSNFPSGPPGGFPSGGFGGARSIK